MLATQHLLCDLATPFEHEANVKPSTCWPMLDQCWIIWPGLNRVDAIANHSCH